MSEISPLVEACDVAIGAGGRLLCTGLSFAVREGECWAIVGPNGAGKTTLLRALAGLAAPAAGCVRYSGIEVATMDPRARARHRAFLPQDSVDAFPATVLETALVGRHPHLARFAWERDEDVARALAALSRFGLRELAARDVRTLSGGERRRAALAALLVQDTALALLDEPSSHLDIAQQAAALEVFVASARARQGALVIVLHDLHLATRFCDHAIAIGGGQARAGHASDVFTEKSLSSLYGRPLAKLAEGGLSTFVPR